MRCKVISNLSPRANGMGAFVQNTSTGRAMKVKRSGGNRGRLFSQKQRGVVGYVARSWRYTSPSVKGSWASWALTVPMFAPSPDYAGAGAWGAFLAVSSVYLRAFGTMPPPPSTWSAVAGFGLSVAPLTSWPNVLSVDVIGTAVNAQLVSRTNTKLSATPSPSVDGWRVQARGDRLSVSNFNIAQQAFDDSYQISAAYSVSCDVFLVSSDLANFERSNLLLFTP